MTPLSPTLLPRGRAEQHVDIHRRGRLRPRAPEGRVGQVQWLPLVPGPGECGGRVRVCRHPASGPRPPLLGLGPPQQRLDRCPGRPHVESGSQGVGQSGYQGVGVWGSQLGTRSQGLRVSGSRGVGFSELESWSRGLREWGCRGVGISELGSQGVGESGCQGRGVGVSGSGSQGVGVSGSWGQGVGVLGSGSYGVGESGCRGRGLGVGELGCWGRGVGVSGSGSHGVGVSGSRGRVCLASLPAHRSLAAQPVL